MRGVAHDSAPVRACPVRWAQAATAVAVGRLPHALRPHSPVYRVPLLTPLCTAASAAHMALPWNAAWIRRSSTATAALFAAARGAACCCGRGRVRGRGCALPPSLFLYSDSDPLVPVEDVRAQAQVLRKRHREWGCVHPEACVRECFFRGSNHVDHLRTHPAQYVDALVKFCRDCIEI